MSSDLTRRINELLEHNKKMVEDAEAGNWEKVTENEIIRQQLIKTFYSATSNIPKSATIDSATHELLLVNEKLKQLAVKARNKVSADLAEIGKSKVAIDAYTKHMR